MFKSNFTCEKTYKHVFCNSITVNKITIEIISLQHITNIVEKHKNMFFSNKLYLWKNLKHININSNLCGLDKKWTGKENKDRFPDLEQDFSVWKITIGNAKKHTTMFLKYTKSRFWMVWHDMTRNHNVSIKLKHIIIQLKTYFHVFFIWMMANLWMIIMTRMMMPAVRSDN